MELLIIWCLFAIASAAIASSKGRSGVGWLLLGLLFGIFAVIIVACLPSLKSQTFVMTNPDGTATMIQSVPQKSNFDGVAFLLALVVVFGSVGILTLLIKIFGG